MNNQTPIGGIASFGMRPPTRREFLQRCGAGLLVWVALGPRLRADSESESQTTFRARPTVPTDFNAFLSIAEDGRITCFTGKIEMGQGPITSLPQMLADELDAPLDAVEIVMGDTELCPFDQGTWGSLTTRSFGVLWRKAAAEARAVLLALAAERWAVPVERLRTVDGRVVDTADPSQTIGYGELTKGRRIERKVVATPDLKKPAEFKIVGKPLLRRDSRAKVTGEAKFTGDLRLPGMLYARILRPPAHGAKLRKVDTAAAEQVEGARVVRDGDFIAVLHALPDVAEDALNLVSAEWAPSPSTLDHKNIFDHLDRSKEPTRTVKQGGDLAHGRTRAVQLVEHTYRNAYVAHAAMETHTALAQIEGDRATIWASTQNPFGVREEVARTLGFAPEQVRVITPFVGGGFGGKASNQQASEAARLAKLAGCPVMLMWTREEEFFLDTFRPAAVVHVKSGVDAEGRIAFWDYTVKFAGDRGGDLIYDVADHRIAAVGDFWGPPGIHPFGVGAWRAPGCNTNAFCREQSIDELARLAGADPIEFRLRNLKDPRAIRVLRGVAEHWGWQPQAGVSGRGLGVAIGFDAGTYVATVAEVAVDRETGHVTVKRVMCVQEMGLLINPAGAKQQMESCITMGLGYALTERVRFANGVLQDTNFDTYAIPLFSWLPKMDTIILDADDQPPQGGGEPAIIVMGAVIANAIHDATGARLWDMPMTPAKVKAALAATGT